MSADLQGSGSGEGHVPHPVTHEGGTLSYRAKRVLAIQRLLVDKGVISDDELRLRVDALESRSPSDGARVVARAWVDEGFKQRLVANPRAAVAELGYALATESDLGVVVNDDRVHHLVVCTLCSCYPTSLLGRPPDWYKSFAYRSRAVVDPRGVMREFGLELDKDVQVAVLDSSADLRYMVLPRRPAGTEDMSEEELAKLVTRDSLIGVADALSPASVATSG